jgi:hypothetical protein
MRCAGARVRQCSQVKQLGIVRRFRQRLARGVAGVPGRPGFEMGANRVDARDQDSC